MRAVIWVGSSLDDLRTFPDAAQDKLGYDLFRLQVGEMPEDAKWLRDIPGVQELRADSERGDATFRLVYTVKLRNGIYVLHCFGKKSTTGIRTPQREIDAIRRRLKEAMDADAPK